MEDLIRELNSPANQGAPERIDRIQKEIQRLQREPSAWQLGLALLSHEESLMRFYGALTLTIKVNADWDKDIAQDDRNGVNQFIESLVSSYVKLWKVPDADYVLSKLSGTLSAVFEKPNAAWALPFRHILACILADRYVSQDEVPDMAEMLSTDTNISTTQLKAVLRFALSITEDLGQAAIVTRGHHVNVRLSNNADDIWHLVSFCVASCLKESESSSGGPGKYKLRLEHSEVGRSEILKLAILLVPYWTSYIKTESTSNAAEMTSNFWKFSKSVEALLRGFDDSHLANDVLQMITALETDHHRLLQKAVPQYCERIINSSIATVWVSSLMKGNFDPEETAYADFLDAVIGQIDPTSPAYLQNEQYISVIQQAQKLLHCDGVAIIEDIVCRIALEIMSTVAEGFNDWPDPSPFDTALRQLILDTCSACLLKIRIPDTELDSTTQTWDEDERAMFEDFRYDTHDFFQTAFSTLGAALIEEITRVILQLNSASDYNTFEASLFAFTALSDALAGDPEKHDQYVSAVLECDLWKHCTSRDSNVPVRLSQTIIKFLGENTAFLQRHPGFLVNSLEFLFKSLHMHMVSGPASRAIYTLCDSQRASLTDALPQFLGSLSTISDLSGNPRYRIYGAVSAIIQALPEENQKVGPLRSILSLVEDEASQLQNLDEFEVIGKSTDIIHTLTAVGKGLRSLSDSVVDLDPSKTPDRLFWTQGVGASVQQTTLQIFSQAFSCYDMDRDVELVAASCDFLRAGFTEDHPSPFKFENLVSIQLLSRLLELDNPNLEATMSTASSYLSSVSPSDSSNGFETLLTKAVDICQQATNVLTEGNGGFMLDTPSSVLDFLGRLLQKWGITWFTSKNSQQSGSIVIDFALVLLKDSDTLPRRISASFLASLFEVSGPGSPLTIHADIQTNLNVVLDHYSPRVVGLIIYLLGGECARSELESLSEPLRRFVARHPLRAKSILRDALQAENGVLSEAALQATKPEQRTRFAAQVEMLRGSRKTNEVVRDFWVSCKGSSFGYVT